MRTRLHDGTLVLAAGLRRAVAIKDRAAPVVILVAIVLLQLAGAFEPIQSALDEMRFRVLSRPATGGIVVVGIDARSLQELDIWPWPRGYHAALVDRLAEAGARSVVFDVDFSARTTPEADAALADALHRFSGSVILPAFAQLEHGRMREGAVIESLPIPALRTRAILGSAMVRQEDDGLVRRMPVTELTRAGELPSIAALLAGDAPASSTFEIDYGIRPTTLPIVSFVDVLRGTVDRSIFSGKDVIVGAVAIELGDTLPVPVWHNLPGPIVIALAAESLRQGRGLQHTGDVPTLVAVCLVVLALARWMRTARWQRALALTLGFSAAVVLGGLALQAFFPVILASAALHVALALLFLYAVFCQLERQAMRIFRQSMAGIHRDAMFRSVVESSFDGVVVADRLNRITTMNPAAERLFGRNIAEVLGGDFADFITTRGEPRAFLDEALATEHPVEAESIRADGSRFCLEIVARRSLLRTSRDRRERRMGDRASFIYTVRDISARKAVEEERRAAHEEAVASSRAKSEFLAAISHELRTPLNAIIGFSDIVKSELFGAIGETKYVGYAEDIYSSGQHLLSIVNDLLDLAKVEAGKLTLNEETIDLEICLRSALRLVAARAEEAKLDLRSEFDHSLPMLRVDARLLKQIVVNLLSNAVKFTPAGGRIGLHARTDDAGAICIAISDTGIGIPANQLDEVMKPFHQVEGSLARKYEGTGLGLPLVAAYMELHGGRVELASTAGKGTVATCVFPPDRVRRQEIDAAA